MIQVNELRIGNYLKNFLGDFFEVNLSTLEMFSSGNFKGFNKPEPIEITEEILLKCGFEWSHYHPDTAQREYYVCNEFGIELYNQRYYKENVEIKYLHQLQNLYYALCNEELKIKL